MTTCARQGHRPTPHPRLVGVPVRLDVKLPEPLSGVVVTHRFGRRLTRGFQSLTGLRSSLALTTHSMVSSTLWLCGMSTSPAAGWAVGPDVARTAPASRCDGRRRRASPGPSPLVLPLADVRPGGVPHEHLLAVVGELPLVVTIFWATARVASSILRFQRRPVLSWTRHRRCVHRHADRLPARGDFRSWLLRDRPAGLSSSETLARTSVLIREGGRPRATRRARAFVTAGCSCS